MPNIFDPENVSKSDMNRLANVIEEYLDTLKSTMVIPDEIMKSDRKRLKNGLEVTEKLIKKLRKGDRSVFKESDEDDY
jgi:hypothetical protein